MSTSTPLRSPRRAARTVSALVTALLVGLAPSPALASPDIEPLPVTTVAPAAATSASSLTDATTPQGTAREYYPLPEDGVWQVRGRGFGHGRGMSQWGAQGAALQGRTYLDILGFYYPGTGLRSIGDQTVRVLLEGPTNAQEVTFLPRTGTVGPMVTTTDGRRLQGPVLTVRHENGALRAQVRDTVGGAPTATGLLPSGTVVHTASDVLTGTGATPARATWYRGDVVLTVAAGRFEVVNHLPMQHYLYGVVPRESPASWHPEALKAQAVAARTYEQAVAIPTGTNDICDTIRCQVYGGRSVVDIARQEELYGENAATNAAVDATAGFVVTRSGTDPAPAFTQFSSSSGGYTVAGSAAHPYLVARPDPWSGSAPDDPASVWSVGLSAASVAPHCPAGGSPTALEVTARDTTSRLAPPADDLGGRVTGLTVHCTTGSTALTTELEMRLGMKSSWWRPLGEPSMFHLSDTLGTRADRSFEFGPRGRDDVLVGDWDGDGVTGIGYRTHNVLFLRATPDAGATAPGVPYGRAGDAVLVGDWTGAGPETVGVRRGNVFHLRYAIAGGDADLSVPFGRADDEVLVGDWDGDGVDTPGVRRGNVFHLRNSWASGTADLGVSFGRADDEVVIGDWDGDGVDTPGVRRGNRYFFQSAFLGGVASESLAFGRDTDTVLVGDWDGDGRDTLGLHRLGR